MKKMKNVFLFIIVILLAVFSLIPSISATETKEKLSASKRAIKTDELGIYDIVISVPGVDSEEKHDEIILMVDGSYSGDDEWEDMKATIIKIAETTLNGEGNTQLTLMAFGMGDNEVIVHAKSVEEVESVLGNLPGSLLRGVSSTNNEAGFNGVLNYIENHDNTLNQVQVIYISDGNVNTDETPHNYYNWRQNPWLRYKPAIIIDENLYTEVAYYKDGGSLSPAFVEVFGNENPEEILTTATDEQKNTWVDLVWKQVYEESNLNPEKEYSVSRIEKAFLDYDDKHNSYIKYLYYYSAYGRSYPNRYTRTPASADNLAANEKVQKLYIVDYDGETGWMKNDIKSEKKEYIYSATGISGLLTSLEGVLTDLSSTTYYNPEITDYTSKWVDIVDVNEDGIINEKDITVTNQGKLVENANVKVTEITDQDNTNGKLYKIEWSIKEGMLVASDNYKLTYKVRVDTQEKGYNSNNNLEANSQVILTYDEGKNNQLQQTNVIGEVVKIDPVTQKENIIIIEKIDEEGNPLTGANFDIKSETGLINYKKEYSIDGINWTSTYNDKVTYFRLSGLYDYEYVVYESTVPKDYLGTEDITIDFINKEGQTTKIKVTNEKEGTGSTEILPPDTNTEDIYLIPVITSLTLLLLVVSLKKEILN